MVVDNSSGSTVFSSSLCVECEWDDYVGFYSAKIYRSIRKSMIYMTLLPKTTGVWREICVIILYTV